MLASKGGVLVNVYVVVTADISKWYAPFDWIQYPIYNTLDIALRIKGLFGYSLVSK